MKKCPNCSKLLPDDALVCDECNTKLEVEDTVSESNISSKKDKSMIGELAVKYSQGDLDVYEELYEEGYKLSLRVAKSFMYYSYNEDMQDIAQEVTIKCINAISTMPDPSGFGGFLTNATKNKCRDFLKSAYFRHEKDNDTIIHDEDGNETDWYYNTEDEKISYRPEEKMNEGTRQDIIKEIMSGLSEGQRLAIIYRFYEGMSVKEIAEQLGEKETTIKGRLSTAKAYIGSEVEKIQKRDEIKLYSLSPIPFFIWLLGTFEKDFPEGYAYGLTSEVSVATTTATTTAEATSSTASSVASEKAVTTVGKAKLAASAASKKIVVSTGTKIFVSVAVGFGIVGGGIAVSMNKKNNEPVAAEKAVETVKPTTPTSKTEKKETAKKAKATATPSATPKSTPTPTVEATPEPVQEQPQQQTQAETVVEQPVVRTPSSISLSEVEAFIGYSDGQTQDSYGTRFTYKIWCASQGYTSQSSADSVMTSYSNSINNWPDSISYVCLDDNGNLYLYEGENAVNFVAECVVYGSSIS